MKRPVLLIVSLSLNFLLAAAIVWAKGRPAATPPHSEPVHAKAIAASTSTTARAPELTPPQTNEITAPFHWRDVESTDYQVYLENLRGIDCPELRIRDIIVADVDAMFAARARDYVAPLQGRFWEFAAQPRDLEKTMEVHQTALKKLDDEREEIFQVLFNDTNPHRHGRNEQREMRNKSRTDSRLDFLDASQQDAVVALETALNQTNQSIRRVELPGSREATQQQRSALLREAKTATEQKLRELLTPEQYEEYRLRQSPGANVRYQIPRMTLAEAEARSIAKAMADQTAAEAQLPPKDPTTKALRTQLEDQAQEQIKQLLGDTRYGEYQRASDGRYNQTAQIIERLQLPEPTTIAVYQARVEAEKLAARLRASTSASAEERNTAIDALRAETEKSLRALVGDSAYKDYQEHAGGWLNQLYQPTK